MFSSCFFNYKKKPFFPRRSVLSSGDVDDWDRLEVRQGRAGVQNILYLDDEEEEEEDGEEGEQGQEARKVTVRRKKQHIAVLTIVAQT